MPGANALSVAPDGAHVIAWYDSAAGRGAQATAGSFQDVSLITLAVGNDTSVRLTVGFRPSEVAFAKDAANRVSNSCTSGPKFEYQRFSSMRRRYGVNASSVGSSGTSNAVRIPAGTLINGVCVERRPTRPSCKAIDSSVAAKKLGHSAGGQVNEVVRVPQFLEFRFEGSAQLRLAINAEPVLQLKIIGAILLVSRPRFVDT